MAYIAYSPRSFSLLTDAPIPTTNNPTPTVLAAPLPRATAESLGADPGDEGGSVAGFAAGEGVLGALAGAAVLGWGGTVEGVVGLRIGATGSTGFTEATGSTVGP
jgi:hypothetical protein